MIPHKNSQHVAWAAALALTLFAASCATAQQTSRPHHTYAPTPPPPPAGLDGFNDSTLVSTLYLRGAESLADRIVKTRNLDPAIVNALRFPVLVKQLDDPATTTAMKTDLVQKIVEALKLALPTMTDHNFIMKTAIALKENGLAKGLELHEYWGEDQNDQKKAMLPVADAAVKLVDRAIEVVSAKRDATLQGVPVNGGGSNAQLDAYNRLDAVVETYKYNRPFFEYILAICMDANDGKRSDLCDAAVVELNNYPDDLLAKNEIGKLQLAKLDFDAARQAFKDVLKAQTATNEDKDTAYYFAAVNEVLAKKSADAHAAYDALIAWNKQCAATRPPAAMAALDAVARMLQYRIAVLDANNAPNEAAKQAALAATDNILLSLVTAYPQFRPTILERLKNNLPANPNVKTLNQLMLEAMAQGGSDVLAKNLAPDQVTPADFTALKNGAAAAEELLTRPNITPVDQAKYLFLAGVFWDKADEDMKAIDDYLKYMKQYPVKANSPDLEKKRYDVALAGAVDSAGHWMQVTPQGSVTNPDDFKRYKQCIALAAQEGLNNPIYSPYIYVIGKILIANENPARPKDALEWLKHVPTTDSNYRSSQFWSLICNKQLCIAAAAAKDEAGKKQFAQNVIQLAPDVSKGFEADAAKATDKAKQQSYARMSSQTNVEAADLALRVMNDPATALTFLEGVEEKLQDDPGAASLVEDVVKTKIVAFLDTKQTDKAVGELKNLLQKDPKKAFLQVGAVVDKLGNDFKTLEAKKNDADKRGDQELSSSTLDEMRVVNSQLKDLVDIALRPDVMPADMLAKDRAQWEQFRLVVAGRQAMLESDPVKRQAAQRDVVAQLDKLIASDPQNMFLKIRQADVNFELGDYAKAQPVYADLYVHKMLGEATVITADTGKVLPNEKYWDLAYKIWKCNAMIGKADPTKKDWLDGAVQDMKRAYIRFGPELTGTIMRSQIDDLRKEIAPDFDPVKWGPGGTSQAAASQPAVK